MLQQSSVSPQSDWRTSDQNQGMTQEINVLQLLKVLMAHERSILFLCMEVFLVDPDVAQVCIELMAEHVNCIFVCQPPKDQEPGLTEEECSIVSDLCCQSIQLSTIKHDH